MLRKIFLSMERTPLTLGSSLLAFLGIVIIRTFLEDITYRTTTTFFSTEIQTIIHYALFYFVALLGLILILFVATKRNLLKVSAVGLLCFPVILTPPLIDFILFKGTAGNQITYILKDVSGLLLNFFTFYQFQDLPGMSAGIRLEFALIFIGVFLYIYTFTASVLRSVAGTAAAYVLLFVLFSLPSIIAIGSTSPSQYISTVQNFSLLPQNFFHHNIRFSNVTWFQEMLFNGTMSIVLFAGALILTATYAWNLKKAACVAILKNARPERILHYSFLIGAGIWLGSYTTVHAHLNWLSLGSIVCLFISFWAAWLFAVGYNDIIDVAGDTLSNQNRPLVTGALSLEDIRVSNLLFLCISFLAGYLAGTLALYMVILFTALYYVYSAPPLKLKRFLGINPFIIGLCALSAFFAGYFTLSSYKTIDSLSMSIPLLILISYTLVANVKDIKDVAGDSATSVYTIPVVFGDRRGRWIISTLVAIALTLPPLFLSLPKLFWLVPPFAIATTILLLQQPFVERRVFLTYYAYILSAILVMMYG